ncbi:hypothetical protein FACS1894111_05780 [Clostridia bacterium]|nr:hypothetical protein FACS1894111_05780 [Clostridia bacterium]
MYEINEATLTPENFFAGDFPIERDFGTAGATIAKHEPVKLVGGQILPVTLGTATAADEENVVPARTAEENTVAGLYGIAAEDAATGEETVIYLTGEFFTESIPLKTGVTADVLKPHFRKLNIFLKEMKNNG